MKSPDKYSDLRNKIRENFYENKNVMVIDGFGNF